MGSFRWFGLVLLVFTVGFVVSFDLSSTTYSGREEVFDGGDSLASSTSSSGTLIFPTAGRISDSVGVEMPVYTASFEDGSGEYTVVFDAYDAPLRLTVERMVGSSKASTASGDMYYLGDSVFEYQDIFEGIDIEYGLEDRRLKEMIIIEDEDALTSFGLSSSTVSIEFTIEYPDIVGPSLDGQAHWSGETSTTSGDISFIRKKEPHKLYVVNKFYTIKAPSLKDSKGKIMDLHYTLKKESGKTILQLDIPPITEKLEYPLTIDPTIEWDENDGINIQWENWDDCSSNTNDCTNIDSTPEGVKFSVDWNCNDSDPYSHPIQKGLFEFDITDLYDYGGDLDDARIWTKGSCTLNNLMPDGSSIYVSHIDEFSSGADCGDNPDSQGVTAIREVMNDDSCPGSTKDDTYVADLLEDSLSASDDYFAFKLDITPTLGADEGPSNTYKFEMSESNIELEYSFDCTDSNDCPSAEFCKDLATDLCEFDLDYGDNCENIAVDDDNYACTNDNCQYDDFDNSGYYCTEDNKCLHNGNRYNNGTIHCAGDESYYKTCQTNTTWTTQTNCTSGCTEGAGCNTTTTTSTTTTTLIPDITVNPTTITHRRYV